MSGVIFIASMIGAGVSAYGSYQSGKQAQNQAKAQAAWHHHNAKVAQKNKAAQDQANLFASRQQQKMADAAMGRRRVAQGAAGVAGVSPLLVAEDEAVEYAKEAMQTRMTGERQSARYQSRSILDISKASAAKSAASSYGRAAVIGAGSTMLKGSADAGYKYYMMEKAT